jgi:hypothetical protein
MVPGSVGSVLEVKGVLLAVLSDLKVVSGSEGALADPGPDRKVYQGSRMAGPLKFTENRKRDDEPYFRLSLSGVY